MTLGPGHVMTIEDILKKPSQQGFFLIAFTMESWSDSISYKTGFTSQSSQNSLITTPWKLLLASEEVRSYVLSVMPTPRRGTNKITLQWE